MRLWLLLLVSASFLFNWAQASAKSPYAWPKQVLKVEEIEWKDITRAQAPPGIKWRIRPGATPEEIASEPTEIAYIDLDRDGIPELFVDLQTRESAGPYYDIFKKAGDTYKPIGNVQGQLFFCTRYNGYYQIEVWSRGGGVNYSRELYRFFKGRYRCVRLEDCIDWLDGDSRYVRSRRPMED